MPQRSALSEGGGGRAVKATRHAHLSGGHPSRITTRDVTEQDTNGFMRDSMATYCESWTARDHKKMRPSSKRSSFASSFPCPVKLSAATSAAMGRVRRSRTHGSNKVSYRLSVSPGQPSVSQDSSQDQAKVQKTKRYQRDLDQIQCTSPYSCMHRTCRSGRSVVDLLDPSRRSRFENNVPLPEDTSGFGAYPCTACDRQFISAEALKTHMRSKPHKKRVKDLKEAPFTQAEADAAVGRGVDNRQKPATMPGPPQDVGMLVEAS